MSAATEGINLTVLAGALSSDPRDRDLRSGTRLRRLEVTTRTGAGAHSVPVAWFDPPASAAGLAAGDEVVVVGQVRRRYWGTPAGPRSHTEVVASAVVPASQRARARRTLARAAEALHPPPAP
jgi:single-strand DNA-binding protein